MKYAPLPFIQQLSVLDETNRQAAVRVAALELARTNGWQLVLAELQRLESAAIELIRGRSGTEFHGGVLHAVEALRTNIARHFVDPVDVPPLGDEVVEEGFPEYKSDFMIE